MFCAIRFSLFNKCIYLPGRCLPKIHIYFLTDNRTGDSVFSFFCGEDETTGCVKEKFTVKDQVMIYWITCLQKIDRMICWKIGKILPCDIVVINFVDLGKAEYFSHAQRFHGSECVPQTKILPRGACYLLQNHFSERLKKKRPLPSTSSD